MNTPTSSVSPGIAGFLAFFLLALALWLLMRNMNARMRRMSYAAEEAQRRAEAEATGRPAGEADVELPEEGMDGEGTDGEGTDREGTDGQAGKPPTGQAPAL